MAETEQRGDARPSVFGSHENAEWNAVQGKYGPITLWRTQNGHSEQQSLTRESAEELWRELGGFLGHTDSWAERAAALLRETQRNIEEWATVQRQQAQADTMLFFGLRVGALLAERDAGKEQSDGGR